MRRRRRAAPPADSLELLLDTLCNTFGGILFIAILVVILLQMTGGRSSSPGNHAVSADELEDLAAELDVVTREVDSLRRSLSTTVPDAPIAAVETDELDQRVRSTRTRLAELIRLSQEKLVMAGRHDAGRLAIDEDLATLKQRSARAAQEIDHLRNQIAKERHAHSRTIRTPVMHQSSKRNLSLELRYARLYLLHRYSPSGERLGPNLDDYVVLSEQRDGLRVTADPTRGLPLSPNAELKTALKAKMSRFNPDRWDFDLAVRADSFDVFHPMLEAVQDLGYEMRLLLVEDDGVFSDRGGTRDAVQ